MSLLLLLPSAPPAPVDPDATPLPAWLTRDGLKLRLDKQLDIDDDLLDDLLEAAFMQAQAPSPYGTGRVLLPQPAFVGNPATDTAAPLTLDPIVGTSRFFRIKDARVLTAVTLTDTQGTVTTLDPATDYDLVKKDGLIIGLNLVRDDYRWCRRERRKLTVTGRFGFVDVPADLREAIYVLAGRMYFERDAQYADQVAFVEGGPAQAYFRQLPPRTKLAFARYAIPKGIVGLR